MHSGWVQNPPKSIVFFFQIFAAKEQNEGKIENFGRNFVPWIRVPQSMFAMIIQCLKPIMKSMMDKRFKWGMKDDLKCLAKEQ